MPVVVAALSTCPQLVAVALWEPPRLRPLAITVAIVHLRPLPRPLLVPLWLVQPWVVFQEAAAARVVDPRHHQWEAFQVRRPPRAAAFRVRLHHLLSRLRQWVGFQVPPWAHPRPPEDFGVRLLPRPRRFPGMAAVVLFQEVDPKVPVTVALDPWQEAVVVALRLDQFPTVVVALDHLRHPPVEDSPRHEVNQLDLPRLPLGRHQVRRVPLGPHRQVEVVVDLIRNPRVEDLHHLVDSLPARRLPLDRRNLPVGASHLHADSHLVLHHSDLLQEVPRLDKAVRVVSHRPNPLVLHRRVVKIRREPLPTDSRVPTLPRRPPDTIHNNRHAEYLPCNILPTFNFRIGQNHLCDETTGILVLKNRWLPLIF